MKHFLIIKLSDKDKDNIFTDYVKNYIEELGGSALLLSRTLEQMSEPVSLPEYCDCIMVLGGDGSILRTVRAVYLRNIPIVGVNFGNLGYLTQTEPDDVKQLIDRLFSDDISIESRMMLEGTMYHKGRQVHKEIALNDIVVGRGGICRIIRLRILVNGELLNVYDADGVVVSTPTGSTAYNLSAGGPVVCPKTNIIVVTPISPHSLSARSVILSDKDSIQIEVEKVRAMPEEAVATFDGQIGKEMEPGDIIKIERSPYNASLVRVRKSSFYEVLRNKMGNYYP